MDDLYELAKDIYLHQATMDSLIDLDTVSDEPIAAATADDWEAARVLRNEAERLFVAAVREEAGQRVAL